MSNGFIDLRQNHAQLVEESFWPSFTDIMTVVVMIFLIATSILIVKNWELVKELQTRILVEQKISQRLKASMAAQQKTSHELLVSQDKRQEISRKLQLSLEAERRTSEVIQKTSKENATLEETLVHTQSELSLTRLQLMQAKESAVERDRLIVEQDRQLAQMQDEQKRLNRTIDSGVNDLSQAKNLLAERDVLLASMQDEQKRLNRTIDSGVNNLSQAKNLLAERDVQLTQMTQEQKKLNQTINSRVNDLSRAIQKLAQTESAMNSLQEKLEMSAVTLSRRESELEEQLVTLTRREQELGYLSEQNQVYRDNISNYERQISNVQQSHSVLVGEYEDLEDKYNKLIKPSRSAIGKHVVEVRYEKIAGKGLIQFRSSDKGVYQNISESKLHEKLTKLKAQYKKTLYVKIIIPDNSGLSYSEAWGFMVGLLEKYDYYYQD